MVMAPISGPLGISKTNIKLVIIGQYCLLKDSFYEVRESEGQSQ